jgi:hypothetical protein
LRLQNYTDQDLKDQLEGHERDPAPYYLQGPTSRIQE